MTYIHSTLFMIHILFGTAALILFWVPMATKKGSLNHKKFGTAYKNVMYVVAGSGALMALIVLAIPLQIKHEYASSPNAEQIAQSIRYFWLFLLYLALLSFTSTRHGQAVLDAKDDRTSLRTFNYVTPLWLLLFGGVGCLVMGIALENPLHIAFGVLGIVIAIGMLRYVYNNHAAKGAYKLEHIGAMIGSGIGAYTAFLAFGARQVLENAGSYQLIFWIAPGILGTVLSFYLTNKYARVFRIQTPKKQDVHPA
ncbi:hypothetical protein KJ365_05340 [Glaciecola sp. XM2]|jgi:hypothetical protein|uniref:hypothetical protein n=1 Tax=Glaciecola sp. XM2 TaxID=1914931 RepID=UPI001BDE8DD2|nr:hypothetical protein [Glaciecola sp. XM2]MBT1450297.1 hypothetical protein [Glaciecola sp. XM2]